MRWHLVLGGVLFLLTSALIAACEEGEEAQLTVTPIGTVAVTPSPTLALATPSPSAEAGDWEGFRAFATQIEAAVADSDVDFFMDRAAFREIVCQPGPAWWGYGLGAPCEEVGQVLQVVGEYIVLVGEGSWAVSDRLRGVIAGFFQGADPALSDQYGDGQARLYCLARSDDEYRAVLTNMRMWPPTGEPEPVRQLLVLHFRFQDGRWQFGGFGTSPLSAGWDLGRELRRQAADLDWEKR